MPPSAKDIFLDALDLTPTERPAFVAEKCEGDAALLKQVSDLLAADASAKFIDKASMALGEDWAKSSRQFAGKSEQPGDVIEYYRLIRPIGEGGFGTVFLAQQEQPVVRQVALKVLKLGMNTQEIVRRFEGERQTLAMMDHPNIARVYDAGATDAGRPYFVMEFVDGPTITDYATRKMLGVRERLELFEQVCLAIQHAHQKGVIHRDLKPGNILVTEVDNKPEPKVIDFGIAKATNPDNAFLPAMTREMQIVGTPQYMSPEQAGGAGAGRVDTRSDVYSLGTVLYELMAGVPPFNPQSLRGAALDVICQIIREETPAKPSTRLADAKFGPRATQGATLTQVRQIAGEVDWIVMKALEKEPGRRYQSAADLAADIRNHLEDRAVLAGPPSRLYQARKFARRHRPTIAAASLIVIALLGATVISLVSANRARAAEARALADEKRAIENEKKAIASEATAQRELARATAVSTFAEEMLGGVAPAVAKGRDTTLLREVLADASTHATEQLAGEPIVNLSVRGMIAEALFDLGDNDAALREIEPAYWKVPEADAVERDAHQGANIYVTMLMENNRAAEALPILERILAALGAKGKGETYDAMSASVNLGQFYGRTNRLADAETMFRKVIETQTKKSEADDALTQSAMNSLAIVLANQNRMTESTLMYRQLLASQDRTIGPEATTRLQTQSNLAHNLAAAGNNGEALEAYEQILATQRRIYPVGHRDIVKTLNNYGFQLMAVNRLDAASALFEEAMGYERANYEQGKGLGSAIMVQLIRVRRLQHRSDEAAVLAQELVDWHIKFFGDRSYRTLAIYPLLFASLADANRGADGIAIMKQLEADDKLKVMANDQRMAIEAAVGMCYAMAGDLAEARRRSELSESFAETVDGKKSLSIYNTQLRALLDAPAPR